MRRAGRRGFSRPEGGFSARPPAVSTLDLYYRGRSQPDVTSYESCARLRTIGSRAVAFVGPINHQGVTGGLRPKGPDVLRQSNVTGEGAFSIRSPRLRSMLAWKRTRQIRLAAP